MIDPLGYDALKQLATFAAETTFDDIPDDVIDRAHWVLRDTVGVILGGLTVPEVANLAQYASENYAGQSKLLGTNASVRPEWAGLVYGTAGTTLEFDEGHAFARGHAAIHAVSCVLAMASAHNLSGKEAITALVIGYEVAVRIGIASKLRPSVHPFGAWGVVGASAISAKIAGFNADDMLAVFDLAASYAITPSYKTALQGANVRNTYAGMVNHNGLLAVEMFKLGFRGEHGGVFTTFGEILGQSMTVDSLTDDLGNHYEIMRGYFKPYSACRYSHAAIDATLAIREQIDLSKISQIKIETYDFAATLSDPQPKTPLAARFSIPYIVATTLIDGDAGAESFTDEALQRKDVRQLAEKISIKESAHYTAMLPEKRSAKITIMMGKHDVTSEAIGSKGDPNQPMSEPELFAKFRNLTSNHYTSAAQESLWQQLGNLAQLGSIDTIFEFDRDKSSFTEP